MDRLFWAVGKKSKQAVPGPATAHGFIATGMLEKVFAPNPVKVVLEGSTPWKWIRPLRALAWPWPRTACNDRGRLSIWARSRRLAGLVAAKPIYGWTTSCC